MTTISLMDSLEKLRGFTALPYSRRIDQHVVDVAVDVLLKAHLIGFEKSDVMAGFSGEVLVTVSRGRHYVDVTIESGGATYITHEQVGQPDADYGPFTDQQAVDRVLKEIWQGICASSFESWPHPTILETGEIVSQVWHLSLPLKNMGAVSRFSTRIVPLSQVEVYTNTYSDSIANSLKDLPVFIGNFQWCTFPTKTHKFERPKVDPKMSVTATSSEYLSHALKTFSSKPKEHDYFPPKNFGSPMNLVTEGS